MKKSWKHCDILPKCRLSRNVKVFYISTNRGRLVSFLFLSPLIKKKKEKKTSQNQRKTPKTKNWEIRLCSSLFSFCSDVLQLFFEKYKFHIFLVLFFQVQICFGGGKMLSFWERSPVLAYSSLSIPTAAKAFIPPCNCNVVMVSFSFFFFFWSWYLESLCNPTQPSPMYYHALIFSSQFTFALWIFYAAAAAKSCQSCPTLCDPIDGSPLGSAVPGILQARTLEWVAISFSNAWKWKVKVKSFSRVRLLATPWTAAHQAPPPMGFSRQEYWSGVPLPSPMDIL